MNRTKKYLWLSLLLVVGTAVYLLYRNSYVELEPVTFKDPSFVKYEGDTTFYKNMKIVLSVYYEQYKISPDGKILVKRSLNEDKELIWNYTTRAVDSDWLRTKTYK